MDKYQIVSVLNPRMTTKYQMQWELQKSTCERWFWWNTYSKWETITVSYDYDELEELLKFITQGTTND